MNIRKLKGFLRVAGPTICGCLASIGVIVTAVLSAKGALKAEAILCDEELSVKGKVKAAVPDFIPAGVSGVATLGFRGRIHRKIPFWAISSGESCAKRDFRRKPWISCRLGKRLVPDFCEIVENCNF